MGSLITVFHGAGNRSTERETMPVIRLCNTEVEVLTTSTTSVKGTITGETMNDKNHFNGAFCTVTAIGANQWVTSGKGEFVSAMPAPGVKGTGFPVMKDQSVTFGLAAGELIASVEFA